jgi:ATP-dependent exoDNAse (exonuclease V) beta subunit
MTERKIINGLGCYQVPSGDFYPSVTTVLGETKPEAEKLSLAKWRESVGEEKAMEGANRGTEIHSLCENYFDRYFGLTAEDRSIQITDLAKPYWGNIETLLRRTSPLRIEEFIYHPELKYAGRFDCYGHFDDRDNLVIDFKTSGKPKKAEWIADYFIQTVAYAMAIERTLNLQVDGVAILMSSPEQPQIFMLDRLEMKQYEEQWKQRLAQFYIQNPVVPIASMDN